MEKQSPQIPANIVGSWKVLSWKAPDGSGGPGNDEIWNIQPSFVDLAGEVMKVAHVICRPEAAQAAYIISFINNRLQFAFLQGSDVTQALIIELLAGKEELRCVLEKAR